MTKVLLIAEHDGSHLNVSTARTLACGAAMGDVDVAVFGADTAAEVAAMFEADFARSFRLEQKLAERDFAQRHGAPVARLFSPLL